MIYLSWGTQKYNLMSTQKRKQVPKMTRFEANEKKNQNNIIYYSIREEEIDTRICM